MLQLFTRYRHISLFIVFLLVSLVLLSIDRPTLDALPKPSNILERSILLILQPFQQAVNAVNTSVSTIWDNYINLVNVARENRELRQKVLLLEQEKNRYVEDSLAYERLKDTLQLVEKRKFSTILARVIGHDPSNHSNTITIDRGAADGVKESWPVITHAGIVGITVNVSKYSSKVLLLIDPNCNVSGLIQRTRDQGIVGGLIKKDKKDVYLMKYVSRRAEIREGTVYRISDQSLTDLAKNEVPGFMLTPEVMSRLADNFIPADALTILEAIKNQPYATQRSFERALNETLGKEQADWYKGTILQFSQADALAKLQALKNQQYATEDAFINAVNETLGQADAAKYLPKILNVVQEPEIVISSGLGGIFPKGLMIGTVSKVIKEDQGLFQDIEVTPGVDFSKLEEVLIIQRDDAAAEG